jgi:glycerol-3-phosphate O-acyltransferase
MSTALVSSVILSNRKGGFSEDVLHKKIVWLYEEISSRGGLMSNNVEPTIAITRTALQLLKGYLERKKDVFSPQVTAKSDYKNVLMLSYYRNNLSHIFINEAYIACSLVAFGENTCKEEGVPL